MEKCNQTASVTFLAKIAIFFVWHVWIVVRNSGNKHMLSQNMHLGCFLEDPQQFQMCQMPAYKFVRGFTATVSFH